MAGADTFDFTLTATDDTDTATQDVNITVLHGSDGDLVPDPTDNATFMKNDDQRDTDGDGYGNVVDADLGNDVFVLLDDLALPRAQIGGMVPGDDTGPTAHAHLDGDGFVLLTDLAIFRSLVGGPPGAIGGRDRPHLNRLQSPNTAYRSKIEQVSTQPSHPARPASSGPASP